MIDMALTLAEAAKLSNDILLQGVIEETIYDSPVLQLLPFIEVVGNAMTYNRENTLPTIDFYDVGDTWAESTPDFTQVTATLKIMGGDADVDNYIKGTRSNIQDIEAAVISLKAKALAHKFDNMFIYGDTDVDSKQFNGIRDIIDLTTPGSQVVVMGATGATLTLNKLDELIDKVKGGLPRPGLRTPLPESPCQWP
jgi:HK97 family phage major capsid protein